MFLRRAVPLKLWRKCWRVHSVEISCEYTNISGILYVFFWFWFLFLSLGSRKDQNSKKGFLSLPFSLHWVSRMNQVWYEVLGTESTKVGFLIVQERMGQEFICDACKAGVKLGRVAIWKRGGCLPNASDSLVCQYCADQTNQSVPWFLTLGMTICNFGERGMGWRVEQLIPVQWDVCYSNTSLRLTAVEAPKKQLLALPGDITWDPRKKWHMNFVSVLKWVSTEEWLCWTLGSHYLLHVIENRLSQRDGTQARVKGGGLQYVANDTLGDMLQKFIMSFEADLSYSAASRSNLGKDCKGRRWWAEERSFRSGQRAEERNPFKVTE